MNMKGKKVKYFRGDDYPKTCEGVIVDKVTTLATSESMLNTVCCHYLIADEADNIHVIPCVNVTKILR